ncbi:MAG TPA: hypothetical protein VJL36_01300 [Candidatus Paceibacterota bacterium]
MKKLEIKVETFSVNLDAATAGRNDRDPATGAYRLHVCANIEADEEFKNLSANDLKARGFPSITLTERLLLGLTFFIATDRNGQPDADERHLDRDNTTLCAGSRRSDGFVPRVSWDRDSRKACVDWCSPDYFRSGLRSCSVVS